MMADAAAANRENHMFSQGAEPLSLWVILGSSIVFLIGGGVLFSGGNLFDYKNTVAQNYTRGAAPGESNAGPTPKPALKAYANVGGKLYVACSGCHGADGAGSNVYPPLANSEWVNGPSLRPAMIVLNGCKGPITVDGKQYNSEMPPQGDGMGPKELAGLLNYIRTSFGNKSDNLISMDMAQNALDISAKRNETQSGQMTVAELNAGYNKDLEGEPVDPETLVDPKTLLPVE